MQAPAAQNDTGAAPIAAPIGKSRRQERERHLRRRSAIIATVSTLAVLVMLMVLIPMAPGWEKVQEAFFNWPILIKVFPELLRAFLVDLMIFAWSAPIIALWGLVIALCRDARGPA